jgi:hypothetical protein
MSFRPCDAGRPKICRPPLAERRAAAYENGGVSHLTAAHQACFCEPPPGKKALCPCACMTAASSPRPRINRTGCYAPLRARCRPIPGTQPRGATGRFDADTGRPAIFSGPGDKDPKPRPWIHPRQSDGSIPAADTGAGWSPDPAEGPKHPATAAISSKPSRHRRAVQPPDSVSQGGRRARLFRAV